MRVRTHNQPTQPTQPVGLGEVIAASTKAVGIKPCGGCQRRREALNRATPNWLRRFLQRFKKSAERTDNSQR